MMLQKLSAEFIGTFVILFVGCGAILANEGSGALGSVGIAFSFGFAVMAMIYSLGEVSGAHFNPAVSFGFWMARRLSFAQACYYSLAQILGALWAIFLLKLIFPLSNSLGATLPSGKLAPAFFVEVFLSAILMFVILNVSIGAKEKGIMAGLAIGMTVAIAAMFGASISGASMNPARSLAPALWSGNLSSLWIYCTAPFLGSALAVAACLSCRKEGCCT